MRTVLSFMLLLCVAHCELRERFQRSINYTRSPIIAVGLPKTGSTSITQFLSQCNQLIKPVHWTTDGCEPSMYPVQRMALRDARYGGRGIVWKRIDEQRICLVGVRVQQALAEGKPPLHYIFSRGTNAVMQMDASIGRLNIWPQIDALDRIMDAYPNALYIHNIRNISNHVSSLMRWRAFALRLQARGLLSRFPLQRPENTIEKNVELFVIAARTVVRDAIRQRPWLQYLEIDIESDPNAHIKLAQFVGAAVVAKLPHANKNNLAPLGANATNQLSLEAGLLVAHDDGDDVI